MTCFRKLGSAYAYVARFPKGRKASFRRQCDESRYRGWDYKRWLCHHADIQTFKETTALWFLCLVFLIKFKLCVCIRISPTMQTKAVQHLRVVGFQKYPWKHDSHGGGGEWGRTHMVFTLTPTQERAFHAYSKWSNYITVILSHFSATSAWTHRLHLCNYGKLSTKQEDSFWMPHCWQELYVCV